MIRSAILAAAVCGLALASASASAETVAVPDFAYVDTSHEPRNQTEEHAQRLHAFMQALRQDLSGQGHVRLVGLACAAPPCASRADAAKAGADLLLLGGIHKESTLVQWAQVAVIDVRTGHALMNKLFTFRGDSDAAWQHAEAFIAHDVLAALPGPPVRLAVFPFELKDFSAAASVTAGSAEDRTNLAAVTDAVRHALAQSGRYALVDAAVVKPQVLYGCNGCDAPIATRLGAAQSLVGLVTRISRTEYVVHFWLRDARTGALLADQDSGLRIGADYSWSRGATQLVQRWLRTAG